MSKLILFNKPFNVLCQFTGEAGDQILADYINIPKVYPAGRLDKDSEGLLLLTDNGQLQHQISNPKNKMAKVYWVQVEGEPTDKDLEPLRKGIKIQNYISKPAIVEIMPEPSVWQRDPPIRQRQNIPASWLKITIKEGKNRQVRRMTAAIGFPTLRLIRAQIGDWHLANLKPGEYKQLNIPATFSNPLSLSRKKRNGSALTKNRLK